MTTAYFRIFSLVCSILISSCEVVLDADFPEVDSALAVYTFLEPDQPIVVSVYASQSIAESESQHEIVTDASVSILQSGTVVAVPILTVVSQDGLDATDVYRYVAAWPSNADLDEPFTIRVEAPGFDAVQATESVPARVIFDLVSASSVVIADPYLPELLQSRVTLRFELTDPPGDTYYFLMRRPSQNYGDPTFTVVDAPFKEPDPGESEGFDPGLFFSDVSFRSGTIDFSIAYYTLPAESDAFVLYSVSESYFEYDRTRQLQKDTNGNPFAEPAPIFTNIDGGYGVFAASSRGWTEVVVAGASGE